MLKTFLQNNNIIEKRICVGVSGGSDSLALALMANEQLSPLGYKIVAITVNHGLRKSAQDEADYVASVMQQHGIEHHILYWEGDKPQNGIEEAARIARYGLIEKWCEEYDVNILMTAHHLYDQVETFFMRLERGSGLDGLCGMKEVFYRNNIKVIRPLLYTSPKVMKDYLTDKGIVWVEDESNFCTDLLRVKIRQFLPEFEEKTGIDALKVANTMKRLQSSKNYIDKVVDKIIKNNFSNYKTEAFWCSRADFLKLDTEIKFRILGKILRTIAGSDYIPSAEKLFSLIDKFNLADFKASTLGHCYVCCLDNKLWFMPECVASDKYSAKAWKEYVKKHLQYKNKKIPVRLKKIMCA